MPAHLYLPKTKTILCKPKRLSGRNPLVREVVHVTCRACLEKIAEMHPNKEVQESPVSGVPRLVSRNEKARDK